MKYKMKDIEVEAVRFEKGLGIEDGYAVYDTAYPDEGYTFELSTHVDTTRQTIIQAAVRTPAWKVVSEGDWVVSLPSGQREIWADRSFRERFVSIDEENQERYFKFVKSNFDVSGLFKSNDAEMIIDQQKRMRMALTALVEISQEEYEKLERELERW